MISNLASSKSNDLSLRMSAIVAGLGLLLMAILAPIANFGIFQKLIVAGDVTNTANNISASAGMFRMGIFIFLMVAILDVVVAWALYIFVKPVNQSLSLLAAWLRIVYAAIFVSALTYLLVVLQLLNGSDDLKAYATNQLQAQATIAYGAFTDGWNMGLIVFGLHLLVLGYLVFKSHGSPIQSAGLSG